MHPKELEEINAWFDATIKAQPVNSLALLVYVRDGTVTLGRAAANGNWCPGVM